MTKGLEAVNPLLNALSNGPLVAMGPLGAHFQQQDLLKTTENTSLWCMQNPGYLQKALQQWVELGCRVIFPLTSEANPLVLKQTGAAISCKDVCARLVQAARKAAGRSVCLGGDLQAVSLSTGRFLVPHGPLKRQEVYAAYREHAAALEQAGVDLFWLFTMVELQEIELAVQAMRDTCSLPVAVTMAFDATRRRGYRTFMGVEAAEAARFMKDLQVDVFGVNCGSLSMEETTEILGIFRQAFPGWLAVKPNAGMPRLIHGETVYPVLPREMAAHVPDWKNQGAAIISGCCGATSAHLQAIVEKLRES